MSKVVTFGEVMLRLSTEKFLRFPQSKSFSASFGGSEFNVAISLSNFGVETDFVTKLPNNQIGKGILREMKKNNVGFSNVVLCEDRLGIYFLEEGIGIRSSNVIYDREYSAMANISIKDINWNIVLNDASWFHWSGISAAISESSARVCLEAVKIAKEKGLTISTDLNYRSKLWKYGKEPKEIMPELLEYSDIILGDIDTALFMLGKPEIKPDYNDIANLSALYPIVFKELPNLKIMSTTLRSSINASYQKIGGILYDRKGVITTKNIDIIPVVDRVGTGDAFMAGLIFGLQSKPNNLQYALDFAVASCSLKHTIVGDYNLSSTEEVEKILMGDLSGKVLR